MAVVNREYLKLTQDLVSIPSVSSNLEALNQVVDYCAHYFSAYPFLSVKKFLSGGKPSLVIESVKTKTPKVACVGHLDVVPADPNLFTAYNDGSHLRGRGVCDMKGSVAIMMQVIREAAQQSSLSVALWLTSDEEVGGVHGARYLVDELGYRPQVALVPDGGYAPETIVLKNKGMLPLKIRARGVASHASRPWEGVNAIEQLMIAYQELKTLFGDNQKNNKDISDRWYSTCTMGIIRGGEASNQVPESAECVIDIRLAEDIDIATIKKVLKELPNTKKLDIEIIGESQVSVLNRENSYIQLYEKIVTQQVNKPASFITYPGANDSRYLTKYNIPVIVSRPHGGGQHSADEWVDIKSMEDFYQIYSHFIVEAQNLS